LSDSSAYDRLALLTDLFGHRFSGSSSLEEAIDWILEQMRLDGLENIQTQDVLVPKWVRGTESLTILEPRQRTIPILGLGGTASTPPGGLTGEILVVSSFDDLESKSREAAGKIVLFNVPFTTYSETVRYRMQGALAASRVGAIASLIRSVGPFGMQTPHTGMSCPSSADADSLGLSGLGFPCQPLDEPVEAIPHAAITIEDAEYMQRTSDRGVPIKVNLVLQSETYPDVISRNILAEVSGSEQPDEVVIMGGHIDSWDVGTGAMDDAGGCVAAWEALRIIKDLGLRPRRTIRVVMWTNEENGLRGALAYRDSMAADLENHVLAIESDAGVFKPTGFGFSGSSEALEIMRQVGSLLDPIDADSIVAGGGGADIGPLMIRGVPGMGLLVDRSKYFWYHHTHADTIDKLDPREVAESVAALAVAAFVVADMPERLPR
jgi:carboxypeptidase Q